MGLLFEQVCNASFYGGILIVVVCLLRLLLKSAPRKLICLLWLLVGLRLLMPFEIESNLSLQPKLTLTDQSATVQYEQTVPEAAGAILDSQGEVLATRPNTQGRGEILDSQGEILVTKPLTPLSPATKITMKRLLPWLWFAGMASMGIYSLIAYLRLKRRVRNSVALEDGVWFAPGLDTAFVLGLFRPRIYLPVLTETEAEFVLAHEKAHISRKDHWWKFLGYVALAIHWFNPLVWMGYVLQCRDLEMACDEAVIRSLNLADRKAYSHALLACAARHSLIGACPVAFGEVSVGTRIKSVMNYKKPKFWICLTAILAVLVAAVCFLTVPSTKDEEIAARLGGNVFTWEKKYADVFSFEIELDEDGTCYFVDGVEPYYVGYGAWWVEDGLLKIRDDGMMKYRYFFFQVDGNDLVYLADKSPAFRYTDVVDGDRFYMIQDIGNAEEKLTQCRDAFNKWASVENYHVRQDNTYAGNILDGSSYVDYWKSGDDWLYTVSLPQTDDGRIFYRLRKDGVEYQQEFYETLTYNPQGWPWFVAEDTSDCMEGNWYGEFNWENATVQYVRTDIINNNKERVTLSVVEDPSAFGKYCPYTVRFLFDSDGFPLYAYMTLEENKGKHDWKRTDSAYILCSCEESEAKIQEAYAECVAVLGIDDILCNDKDCEDPSHDHSRIRCADSNCTNTAHDHYGIACTVEHCDNPAHGHSGHDHH